MNGQTRFVPEGGDVLAEDSCRRSNLIVLRNCFHTAVRNRRRLGRAIALWNPSLTATTRTKKESVGLSRNAFAGRNEKPTEKALAVALGPSLALWKSLLEKMKHDLKIDLAEWHTGAVKHGWSLRLQLKKRNIVYLGPREGSFVASFALGDKAVAAARKTDLPANVLKIISDAKRYAEGTAVRIDVTTSEDLAIVKTLAKIKIEN